MSAPALDVREGWFTTSANNDTVTFHLKATDLTGSTPAQTGFVVGDVIDQVRVTTRRDLLLLAPDADNARGGCAYTIEARAGTPIRFKAIAQDPDGDDLRYRWDLGDGTKLNGRKVFHTYAEEGQYRIFVVIRDGRGGVLRVRAFMRLGPRK